MGGDQWPHNSHRDEKKGKWREIQNTFILVSSLVQK